MAKSQDVAQQSFTDDDLLSIQSFEDAVKVAADVLGSDSILRADEVIGNGFAILEHKDALIGKPLFFLQWDFREGDIGEFVSIVTVAQGTNGEIEKWIVNDGSTGVMKQLKTFTEKTGRKGGLMVRRGLRRSDYRFIGEDGKEKPASTFYLDTSA
jgi:hypothetical protein